MAAKVVQDEKSAKTVVVVGGGLAGALISVYLAKRGFKVDVFEARKDPRKEVAQRGRSVNLALSVRGIESLRAVGAESLVMALGIPMHARMIHSHSGNTTPIPYGKKGQHLLSVERQKLNNDLLTVAETYPDVRIHFEHKLIAADIEGGHLTFKCKGNDDEKLEVDADIILGCDGAYSALRRELMRRPRFDFSQEYIPHGYKELCLAPTKDGEFAMAVNYLHIWPRQTFMMIALPNQDKSFTCTLFLPFDQFDKLKTKDDVLTFFNAEFPDFLNLMGEEKLLEEFFRNPTGPMVSIKCKPYHVSDKLVIIGDAAHAMVPFYGQGTNCAFEDCLVLDGILEKHNNDFGAALQEYSRTRNKDVEAMCDLAMYNYIEVFCQFYISDIRGCSSLPLFVFTTFLHHLCPITEKVHGIMESIRQLFKLSVLKVIAFRGLTQCFLQMRSLVTSPVFLMKKKLFNLLHWLMPKTFIPLYTMVSFSQIPYKTVIDRSEWQEKVVKRTVLMSALMAGIGGALMALRIAKKDIKLF